MNQNRGCHPKTDFAPSVVVDMTKIFEVLGRVEPTCCVIDAFHRWYYKDVDEFCNRLQLRLPPLPPQFRDHPGAQKSEPVFRRRQIVTLALAIAAGRIFSFSPRLPINEYPPRKSPVPSIHCDLVLLALDRNTDRPPEQSIGSVCRLPSDLPILAILLLRMAI
jgi:hypothetical protein